MQASSWLLIIVILSLSVWQLARLVKAAKRANRVDWGHSWVNLVDGLNRLFCYRYHRLNVLRLRLPPKGPGILVANHVSGLDPFLLIASARRPLRFLIAREQYERFGLKRLFDAAGCIPVDRERNPERALRAALKALKRGEILALFPHGKIHLDSDPPRKIKPGAIRLAELTDAPILPMRISGVAGEGHVVQGVVLRGNAQVKAYPPLYAHEYASNELSSRLQDTLDGKIHS